ncbi:MAG: PLP-dependent aminotransferase family protein [Proteobacteria bacterium]|nr:PLP-dependent aminotransferase family protein [Pseudomonadota bacterium]
MTPRSCAVGRRSRLPFDAVTVDRTSKVRLDRQLYQILRTYILEGRIGAGTSLPATRTLAQHLGVGRNTVVAAYDQLFAEGYVEAQPGSGTRVAALLQFPIQGRQEHVPADPPGLSRRGQLMASRPQPPRSPGKLNFHPGFPESASFPFSTWARLLAKNARRRSDDILSYQSFAGYWPLREAIAEYLAVARGVTCSPEQVIVVTGAQAALDLVARLLLDPGQRAWLEEPGYLGARSALLGGGAELASLRVNRRGWELGDPDLPTPRMIYVTPSCQWPLGTIMRLDERLRLLTLAEQHNAWIIEDDYDGEYRFRGQPVPALRGLDLSERVIYIGTFGKTLFSSLRIGFLVAPPRLAPAFERALSVTGQFAPLLLQATLADFIREGYFATHLKRMRRLYLRRQKDIIQLCRRELGQWMDVSENDAGMQIMGWLKQGLDDRAIASAALRHGVDVQPVSINYRHDPPRHGLLLGYAGLGDRETVKAINGLRAAFQSVDPSHPVPPADRRLVLSKKKNMALS